MLVGHTVLSGADIVLVAGEHHIVKQTPLDRTFLNGLILLHIKLSQGVLTTHTQNTHNAKGPQSRAPN